jgi:hypothetical protein
MFSRRPMLAMGLAAALSAASGGAAIAVERCMVTDPTGTPLNIRSEPGGAIIGVYDNGTIIRATETRLDAKGRSWSKVGKLENGVVNTVGWVFTKFISCF